MKLIDKTISELIREKAETYANRVAINMGGYICTYRQLDKITDYTAVDMLSYGIDKGTHVGIWSVNSPNWVFTFFALIKIGAIPILINTCLKDEEIVGIINYSDIEVLYFGNGYKNVVYQDIIDRIKSSLPNVKKYIHIDEASKAICPSTKSFTRTNISSENLDVLEQKQNNISSSDVACMIFTSGTTSIPKGVMLSHYNLVNNSRALVETMNWTYHDKMCITVPMFHCFGITAGILACLLSGATMCIIPYFKTSLVWETITKYQCTILSGVPSVFLALIRKLEYAQEDASSIKSGIIAGSTFTCEEYKEICHRFYNMDLLPSYGQTETSPCVTIVDKSIAVDERCLNAGKIIEHVELRISDAKKDEVIDSLCDGEIQVRGYNVMLGYYKLDKANAAVFTKDGWLKTGDRGRFDKKGNLIVTGRIKEMIIRAGENISPQEIESVIRELDWVKEVKVIGIPAEVIQEAIVACIIPKQDCSINKEQLIEYLTPRLAHYKLPAYIIKFEEFTLNACGKINLKIIKDMAIKKCSEKEIIESRRK